MKPAERPILFTGPMVRAILDGQKTQTRRVVKPQPLVELADYRVVDAMLHRYVAGKPVGDGWRCPYGKPGDLLYVRETWGSIDADHPRCEGGRKPQEGDRIVYRANPSDACQWGSGKPSQGSFTWRPSAHMPKWASRLWLRVTDVRVERVQEIDEAGADAEGAFDASGLHSFDCPGPFEECCGDTSPEETFGRLWDSINAKRGFGWDANPWVWVVTFERQVSP